MRSDEQAGLNVTVYMLSSSVIFVFLDLCEFTNCISAVGCGDLKRVSHVAIAICGDVLFVKHAPVNIAISIIIWFTHFTTLAIWSDE